MRKQRNKEGQSHGNGNKKNHKGRLFVKWAILELGIRIVLEISTNSKNKYDDNTVSLLPLIRGMIKPRDLKKVKERFKKRWYGGKTVFLRPPLITE